MPIPRWIFCQTTVSNQKQTGKRRSAAPDGPQVQRPGGNGGKGEVVHAQLPQKQKGPGSAKGWGRLKAGGWVAKDWVKKV